MGVEWAGAQSSMYLHNRVSLFAKLVASDALGHWLDLWPTRAQFILLGLTVACIKGVHTNVRDAQHSKHGAQNAVLDSDTVPSAYAQMYRRNASCCPAFE